MVKVKLFFFGDPEKPPGGSELTGMAKRFTALGFQPTVDDELEFADLPNADKVKLKGQIQGKLQTLKVVKRVIKFEDTGFVLHVVLQKK